MIVASGKFFMINTTETLLYNSLWVSMMLILPLEIRLCLLSLSPLNHVFSIIQQQECQHFMLHQSTIPDLMAILAKTNFQSPKPTQKYSQSPTQKSVHPYCTHCKIQGHLIENCFKLGNATPPLCSHCNLSSHSIDKCFMARLKTLLLLLLSIYNVILMLRRNLLNLWPSPKVHTINSLRCWILRTLVQLWPPFQLLNLPLLQIH